MLVKKIILILAIYMYNRKINLHIYFNINIVFTNIMNVAKFMTMFIDFNV